MNEIRAWMIALAIVLPGPVVAADDNRGLSCHIHPPGSTPEQPFGTVGPFESAAACEQARQQRFGGKGRCHCAADFSPRWLPPATPLQPGHSPLGGHMPHRRLPFASA
ncbi:MAG: hypothetical protein KDJ24_10835 [Gammaproteobacteria bacterium]|nr:hypothetical protein [Gammaproteobacteria bacterium]